MQYTSLGRTGLKVSRLCLGTMNFGVSTDEKEALRIMDIALDAGINFFDTADIYGWGENSGTTERIVGRWFAQGGGRRERVVLATKFHEDICVKADGPNSAQGLSAFKLRRRLEGSLSRLQTDFVELYYMHHIDRNVTWDEIWGAYEVEIGAGKIGYAASSNFAGWDLAVAQAAAKSRHFLGIIAEQHKYNLNCRLPELEVLPSAMYHGIGIVPWGPLDGGFLSGNALNKAADGRSKQFAGLDGYQKQQLLDFDALCGDLGHSQNTVAIAWLLANPAVDSPVIGPRTAGQMDDLLKSLEVKLDESTMKRLDEIFPGPGGAAPNVYAW
ncbi:MAG: aldo/keto reductase [Oscillospiraceae bacterium]|nr:aldo/keto reductase [Oscillospiraceae bacterium]